MNAIFRKDLQETGKWALLLVGLFNWVFWWGVTRFGELRIVGPVVAVCTFGCPLVALALGTLQIAQDWSLNRWSFLTHRPISRSRIFLAKVLAGLTMYFIITGLPILLAIVIVAPPGPGRPPFVWGMVMPVIALWFHGLLWYFAAIVVATRDARWYGSRLMPLGLALIISALAIVITMNFVEVFLILAAGLLIFIPMAHGGFVSAGFFNRQPTPIRGLHIAAVTTGAVLLVLAMIGVTDAAATNFWRRLHPYSAQEYHVDADGRVLLFTSSALASTGPIVIDGPPLPRPYQPIHRTTFIMLYDIRENWTIRNSLGWIWSADAYARRLGYTGPSWYYVPSRRLIQGVNLRTGESAGTIGPDGYAAPPAIATPFPSGLVVQKPEYVWDDSHIYKLDLDPPSIQLIQKVGPDEKIIDAVEVPAVDPASGEKPTLFVATQSTLRAFRDGVAQFQLPLIDYKNKYWGVNFTPTRQGSFILHYQQSWVYGPPPPVIVEMSSTGQIIRQRELPLLKFEGMGRPEWLGYVHSFLAPPIATALVLVRWFSSATRTEPASLMMWLSLLPFVAVVIAAILATRTISRRNHLSRNATLGWSLMGAGLGIGGVLTMVMVRGLPLRMKCPACGKPRAIDQIACEQCTALHAPPPPIGVEIFE